MFVIGKVMNTHGVKGELKVKQLTDFADRFDIGKTIYYEKDNAFIPVVIQQSRPHKQALLLVLEGFETLDDVAFLKNEMLYIAKEQQAALEENAYYFHEIIGCTVTTNGGDNLGEIDHILTPGANDVWVVLTPEGKEIYIPYIKQVVQSIDIEKKEIIIEVMEGLLDI